MYHALRPFESVDPHLDHRLAVTLGPPVLLRPLLLEDENFLRLHGAENRSVDGEALRVGTLLPLAAADEDDLGEADLLALRDIALGRLDAKDVAGCDFVLFPARADDGVHVTPSKRSRTANSMGYGGKVKRPGSGLSVVSYEFRVQKRADTTQNSPLRTQNTSLNLHRYRPATLSGPCCPSESGPSGAPRSGRSRR